MLARMCPFCGGEPYIYDRPTRYGNDTYIIGVKCKVCGAMTRVFSVREEDDLDYARNKELAIECWNRRVTYGKHDREAETVN